MSSTKRLDRMTTNPQMAKIRVASRMGVVLIVLLGTAARGDRPGQGSTTGPSIPVRVRVVDPAPYYVGQEIGVVVVVGAGRERPVIVPPVIPGVAIDLDTTEAPSIPVDGTGEGESDETSEVTRRFRLVPSRPGRLWVPPFVARLDDPKRFGRGDSLSLEVRALPASGRTRAFLGGVGRFERVEAQAEPGTLRVGQTFEYRLRLVGSAARGSISRPDLSAFDRVPLGLRPHPLPDEVSDSPSARIVRFRVRATVAGDASLPSLAVAAFDPRSQRYQTWMTPSVPIKVVAVSAFDASAVEIEPSPSTTSPPWPLAILVGLGALGLATLVGGRIAKRARRRRQDPRRCARRLARGVIAEGDPARLAERIEAGLADYFRLAAHRPPGTLTPRETRALLEQFGAAPELIQRGERVVAACDAARYSGRTLPVDSLRIDAMELFQALGSRTARIDPDKI